MVLVPECFSSCGELFPPIDGLAAYRYAETTMQIKVSLRKGEDGYFVARCPALKSCWSQGKTREEALANIREAIALYLEPRSEDLAGNAQEVVEISL